MPFELGTVNVKLFVSRRKHRSCQGPCGSCTLLRSWSSLGWGRMLVVGVGCSSWGWDARCCRGGMLIVGVGCSLLVWQPCKDAQQKKDQELLESLCCCFFLVYTFCIFLLREEIAVFLDENLISSVNSLFWKEACVCFPFGVWWSTLGNIWQRWDGGHSSSLVWVMGGGVCSPGSQGSVGALRCMDMDQPSPCAELEGGASLVLEKGCWCVLESRAEAAVPILSFSKLWLKTSDLVIRIWLLVYLRLHSEAWWLHVALLAAICTRVSFCFYDDGIAGEVALSSLMELLMRLKKCWK